MKIFEAWKSQAVVMQDFLGENILFEAAKSGDLSVYNWFQGSDNFFKARG